MRRADGKPFPSSGQGILFFPSGASGPAFIVTENFDVLEGVQQLRRLRDCSRPPRRPNAWRWPIKTPWPKDDRQLSRDARIGLQKKLSELGYKVNEFEGHIDFDLRDNIRAEQKKIGMLPDGSPTAALLDKLGVKAR